MTKQEAVQKLADLLDQQSKCIEEAVKIADEHGLEFTARIGPVHNQYVSTKFQEAYDALSESEQEDIDFYSEGYDGWQSSSC